jgi:uncharacterized membrane protein YgdD (TMEM256/DUF423 family)
MDGELALWYSRSRKTTDVFSREARQQQVLEAMWQKAREMALWEAIPSLYEAANGLYDTDLTLAEILSLALIASQLTQADVRHYNISANNVVPYTTPYGGSVFLPEWEEIEPVINAVVAAPAANRATQDHVRVEIWNGTEQTDWDLLVADRLYDLGFIPILGNPDRRDHARTQIIVFAGNTKGIGLTHLQRAFGVRNEDVLHQSQADAAVALRIILGKDYEPCSN